MDTALNKLFIFSILLMFTITSGASDTLRIHLTYKHKLDSTGHSSGKMVVNQKIHNPEGVLFREINFDENSGQITGYMFYFYEDGKLSTREYYNQADSLQYILKYEYDQDGNEILITKLVPGKEGLISTEKTSRIFDKNRKLLQQKKFFGKKVGTLIKYQYTPGGYLIQESCKTKPVARLSFREEIRSYSYVAENMLSRMIVTGRDLLNKPYEYHEEYTYDDMGRLSTVKIFNTGNELTGTRAFQYLTGNTLGRYEELSPVGLTRVLLEYEYKKHFMEPGNQVSRYEGF